MLASLPGREAAAREAEGLAARGRAARRAARASSTPGSDQLGVEDREGGLEAGHAHRGLLERDLLLLGERAARGRWRCSRWCPSRSPSISAWRSSSERSGGFILKRASRLRTASSVSARWCGVTSQVTGTPACLRRPTASTDSRAERCWTWIRAVLVAGERGVAGDHRRLRDRGDRRRARAPPRPAPSCMTPSPESSGSSSCSAMHAAAEALVLERPAQDAGAAHRQAVVGEADRAGVARAPPSRSAPRRACPRVTVGEEADRDRGLAPGALAQRARRRRRRRPAARCWPSRGSPQ